MPTYQLRGIDHDLWQRLREKAAKDDMSLKEAVIRALKLWVGDYATENPNAA